jgi:RNA polymerase sigma factor (sigma-70 family)
MDMATGQQNGVIRCLRRIVLLQDGERMTDGQLLDCFLAERDEAAFEVLVRRHGAMVQGVCRRVLHNPHDAEDAFQATFLVLVRKAASIKRREQLSNWLYGAAYRAALEAKARRPRERQVSPMPEPETPVAELWHDLRPLLDLELSRLPDKYRSAIVLCDLEGRTRKEAARRLGVAEGTLSGRLTTARRRLARRLARHGLMVTGCGLATVLSQNASAACVPASLVAATVQAAPAAAAGLTAATGLISVKVAALTQGVLKAMLMTKLKSLTAVVLAIALISGGAGLITYRSMAAEQKAGKEEAKPKAAAEKEEKPKTDKEALQGVWITKSGERNGEKFNDTQTMAWEKLVFADDKVTLKGTEEREMTFTLNPDKKPKEIDLMINGHTFECLYELKGDTLKLAIGVPSRPGELESKEAILLVLEREKK